jgi:DNA-binding winged helix-turn-helix (wHTH) protein
MQKPAVKTEIHKENDFNLGEVVVSPSHNTLSVRGETVTLQPKAMAVLHYLARNQTRVISNHELIEHLWAGRIVTHGSVQKSINSIRTAFADLAVDQELITHYSKRGYQLQIEPRFHQAAIALPETESPTENLPEENTENNIEKRSSRYWSLILVVFGICAIVIYSAMSDPIPDVEKHHKTRFTSTLGYTNETGHERNAAPHPDNQHLVYVHEQLNEKGETRSELMVRNAQGQDWVIAATNGYWFKLAWSPEGKHLVALEVIQLDAMPLTPNFYEKPNYLYSFHIFSLDLEKKLLLEKQLLSQWQGRVFSVSWWDEDTLEFVARQGAGTNSGRYRYSTLNQVLNQVDEVQGATNLIASAVHNKRTVLASLQQNKLQIDFLNEDQSLISRWPLEESGLSEISWIPDGSGVLIYSGVSRKMQLLYLDGQQIDIPIADTKDNVISRPRYSADGQSIFYTEENRSSNILLLNTDKSTIPLTQNKDFNYAASFSPDGKQVVYVSVRNNNTHLWLIESGQERQLTKESVLQKVGNIIWSDTSGNLIFNTGTDIYRHDFASAQTSLIWRDKSSVEPVAYLSASQELFLLKQTGEVKNLWRLDLKSRQLKQLTFGSVGSVVTYAGDIFFQYTSEAGLWRMQIKDDSLQLISPAFAKHQKLLRADAGGVYFISGGLCRESGIQYLTFADQSQRMFLERDKTMLLTSSFHPETGALYTECYLAEANVMQMK